MGPKVEIKRFEYYYVTIVEDGKEQSYRRCINGRDWEIEYPTCWEEYGSDEVLDLIVENSGVEI